MAPPPALAAAVVRDDGIRSDGAREPRPAGEAPSVSTWSRSEQELSFIPSRSSLVGADVPLTVVTDAATPLHAGADADVAVLHGRAGAVPGQLQPVSNDASSLRCMNWR